MNTQDTKGSHENHSDEKEIVAAFARVGAAWARYGLGIARASVETSAHTLEATAGVLGVLADRFGKLAHPENDAAIEEDRDAKRDFVETSAEPRH
jgi:hypothetical protein